MLLSHSQPQWDVNGVFKVLSRVRMQPYDLKQVFGE